MHNHQEIALLIRRSNLGSGRKNSSPDNHPLFKKRNWKPSHSPGSLNRSGTSKQTSKGLGDASGSYRFLFFPTVQFTVLRLFPHSLVYDCLRNGWKENGGLRRNRTSSPPSSERSLPIPLLLYDYCRQSWSMERVSPMHRTCLSHFSGDRPNH